MVPGRVLLLIDDHALQVELERAMQNTASIVIPSQLHSAQDCIRDGKYYAILLSYENAHQHQTELLRLIERSSVPIERILIYQQSEWDDLSALVERGVVTRLVPHFWDVQTMVDLLVRLCQQREADHSLQRSHTTISTEGDEAELRKRILELEMQNRRLLALATTDGLTGLSNRRELNDSLTKEISRSRRFNQPLSFVMCDVDYFKHYNDNYGHPAGDDVLQTIAALMRSRLRVSDMAARYGGEEFGLVLPMTSSEAAIRVADSLRKRIEEHRFPNQEGQPNGNLTISMGIATLGSGAETAAQLIECADRALYKAKQMGRNRVWIFDPDEMENQSKPKE